LDTRKVRETSILLPGDEDDLDPAELTLHDGQTIAGRMLRGDALARSSLTGLTFTRTLISKADLSSARLNEIRWDRVVLRACSLVGANLSGGTFKNVIFEHCRLDSATVETVRAAGPVAFIGCSLAETTFARCGLGSSIFDGCKLTGTTFDGTDLRGADLRGQDLSTVVGISSLRGAVISAEQVPGLTAALLGELDLTVKPTLDPS
jgi:uncharacterized protein YjbI with pentapeptide repeats